MDITVTAGLAGAGVLFLILVAVASLYVVEQQTNGVVERFGRFSRVAQPGLNAKIPFVDRVVGRPSLRVQQLDVEVETKTADDVFVRVMVSVQYYILPESVYRAFYMLDDGQRQIRSFVFDVVRARVPSIIVDDVFSKKDDIANAVKNELAQMMGEFGYGILKALVTDIDPDARVKAAMNEINAAQRLRIASEERGEADKILRVKAAEADAAAKALAGRGIADQRMAIVDGLRESVNEFQKSVPGASPQDVMQLVLMTQYFDTLKDVGAASRTNTILMPHSPGALGDIAAQLRNAMITANAASEGTQDQTPTHYHPTTGGYYAP